jgi:ABC-2 type transport system ATP-binding protein
VSEPQVLFLDEPTTGLDVASTHLIRDVIVRLNRERGMTVFLTTHNMEEAEQLCHRVAIINHGRLAAIDTPTGLRERVTSLRSVRVEFEQRGVRPEQILPTEHGRVTESANGFRVFDARPGRLAQTIAARALHDGIAIESIETLAPSLEDVFLSLTAEIPREPR